MLAVPKLTPVTSGCVTGVVDPARMVTEAGTVTLVVSSLNRETVTFEEAGAERVTVRVAVWFGPTVTPEPSAIAPACETRTGAEPPTYPLEVALIVAGPGMAPVITKVAVVLPER